jgi:hypothetical protein
MDKALQLYFQNNYHIEMSENFNQAFLEQQLTQYINNLINNNFQKLVFLLYKIDINETKLTHILQNTNTDSAKVITHLIIEREMEKYSSRKNFTQNNLNSDEEKW